MIKAVVLDVDGVIKGSKEGVNYPLPHTAVIKALKRIHARGIPVILCTGNYYYSIFDIITKAALHNPHISDRGALISNPLDNIVIEKHCIEKKAAGNIMNAGEMLKNYREIYSDHQYFIQRNQVSAFTKKRTGILSQEPIIVDSLKETAKVQDIIKINIFATDSRQKEHVVEMLQPFQNDIMAAWVGNPAMGDIEVVNITKKGISKRSAVVTVLKNLQTPFDAVLGVGDSMSDWDFMSACKYVAAMGNASDTLKEMVQTKGEGNYVIAGHVDDNGILDVLRYFSL